jgi:hypothetical protein
MRRLQLQQGEWRNIDILLTSPEEKTVIAIENKVEMSEHDDQLMAAQKGYKLDKAILEKCHGIFEEAAGREEFGNGRFVRNLLEQAMMAQSSRLIREYKGKKVSRKALITLKEEDFDVNASKRLEKEKKHPLGFAI